MFYRSFPIDAGVIRATAVDEDGNCTLDEEAVILDALAIAQAAHNSEVDIHLSPEHNADAKADLLAR